MHCGFMDPDDWTGAKPDLPRFVGSAMDPSSQVSLEGCDVCPAWLVRQPAIVTAGEAHLALEKGAFDTFFPNSENAVLEASKELTAAWNSYQSAKMKERLEKK